MKDLEESHEVACVNEKDTFIHPESGLMVMTAYYLKNKQQKCCGKKCLFCPYAHDNVGKNHICIPETCRYQIKNKENQ